MKKILLVIMMCIVLISLTSAEETSFTWGQNDLVNYSFRCYDTLGSLCNNNTYCNMNVEYPNGSNAVDNETMTFNGTSFKFLMPTGTLGRHPSSFGCSNTTHTINAQFRYLITTNGENLDLSNGIIIFGQICVMGLFFGMGRIWKKDKWKLKMFFDILALLMAVIILNTLKLIATQSQNLSKMGDLGLIIGITLISLMIAYFLLLMTIEILQKLKKKKQKKWEMRDYDK